MIALTFLIWRIIEQYASSMRLSFVHLTMEDFSKETKW